MDQQHTEEDQSGDIQRAESEQQEQDNAQINQEQNQSHQPSPTQPTATIPEATTPEATTETTTSQQQSAEMMSFAEQNQEPLEPGTSPEMQRMSEEIFRFIRQCIVYMNESDSAPQQICLLMDKHQNNVQPFHVFDLSGMSPESPFIIAKIPAPLYHRLSKEFVSSMQAPNNEQLMPMTQFSPMMPPMQQTENAAPFFSNECDSGNSNSSSTPPRNTKPSNTRRRTQARRDSNQSAQGEESEYIKGSWTEEEDQKLFELVNVHGTKKWTLIAAQLPGRIGKQCRERYLNHLDPNINKSPWTHEEDRDILKLHEMHGNQWAKIAKNLQGRTANAVKNRWNSALSKRGSALTRTSLPSLTQYSMESKGIASGLMTRYDDAIGSNCHMFPPQVMDTKTPQAIVSTPFNYDDIIMNPSANQQGRKRDREVSSSDVQSPKKSKQHSPLNLEADENMFNPFTNMYLAKSPAHSMNALNQSFVNASSDAPNSGSCSSSSDHNSNGIENSGSSYVNLQIDLQSLDGSDGFGPRGQEFSDEMTESSQNGTPHVLCEKSPGRQPEADKEQNP